MDVEIIEHQGRHYIRSEDREEYVKQRTEQIQNIQSDIDSAVKEIEGFEHEEIQEGRKEQARQLIDKYGLESSTIELIDVSNEESFNVGIDFIMSAVQSENGDPSAGFGGSKKPPSGTSKKQYEQIGRDSYRKIRGR